MVLSYPSNEFACLDLQLTVLLWFAPFSTILVVRGHSMLRSCSRRVAIDAFRHSVYRNGRVATLLCVSGCKTGLLNLEARNFPKWLQVHAADDYEDVLQDDTFEVCRDNFNFPKWLQVHSP